MQQQWVLVRKEGLAFANNEPQHANQEAHTKWFDAFWWENPDAVLFYDTYEEALQAGIDTQCNCYWRIYDKNGKPVTGGY